MRSGPKRRPLPPAAPGGVLKTAIRAELEVRGWSQKDLADLTSLSEKHVSQMLTGKIDGSLRALEKMAAVVGLRLSAGRIDGEQQ